MTSHKREILLVLGGVLLLLSLFTAFLVWRPLRPRVPKVELPKATCEEEMAFCGEDCQDDALGAPCTSCCELAKSVCDKGGSFMAYHIQCLRKVFPERPMGREIEVRQQCNGPMLQCYDACLNREKVRTCLHCCDRQRKLCDKEKSHDFNVCRSAPESRPQ